VGRSIDTTQTATLVTGALDMVIRNRGAQPGVVTHSNHGAKPRLTPWAFADCAHASGLVPSFWARMHHRRRQSALGMLRPAKYDLASIPAQPVA
jgi:transposase InsO family protein